jgi:hypothetical protein
VKGAEAAARFGELKQQILDATQALSALRAELEQTGTAADALDKEEGERMRAKLALYEEYRKKIEEARAAMEKLRAEERGRMDSQDSAEWLDASEGVAAEIKRQADEAQKPWLDLADAITEAFGNSFRGVQQGTQSFGKMMTQMLGNIALSIVNQVLRSAMAGLQQADGGSGIFGGLISGLSGGLGKAAYESSWVQSFLTYITGWYDRGGLVTAAGPRFALPRFADGGEVPAMLHTGEFVLRRQAVSRIGTDALTGLNETGRMGGGGPIYLTVVNDYSGAVDPRGMKTTEKEVKSYVLSDLKNGGEIYQRIKERR